MVVKVKLSNSRPGPNESHANNSTHQISENHMKNHENIHKYVKLPSFFSKIQGSINRIE